MFSFYNFTKNDVVIAAEVTSAAIALGHISRYTRRFHRFSSDLTSFFSINLKKKCPNSGIWLWNVGEKVMNQRLERKTELQFQLRLKIE